MNSSDIKPGNQYAYRSSPRSREPLQRVEALERVTTARGKWKVRFLEDPYPGLEEYVRSACIVAPWSQAKKLSRYEARLDRVEELTKRQWPGDAHAVTEAVSEILASTGEDIYVHKGLFQGAADAIERVAERAEHQLEDYGVAFEHEGELIAPFDTGLGLAKAFAAGEPGTVHQHLDVIERRWEVEMQQPGQAHLVSLVNRWRAGWALAHRWAGLNAELGARDEEIKRLRDIITRHIWDLRLEYAHDDRLLRKTNRLERAVKGM